MTKPKTIEGSMENPYLFNYNKPSRELLLDLMNHTNNTNVIPDLFQTVDIGPVIPITHRKTDIKLLGDGNYFRGTIVLGYKRICLAEFFFGVYVKYITTLEPTAETISAMLSSDYGVYIDPKEIILDITDLGLNNPKSIKVTVDPNSYVWVGEFTIYALPPNYIGDLFSIFPLDYNSDTAKTNAYHYSKSNSWVPLDPSLLDLLVVNKSFFTDTIENRPFLDYMLANTGDNWVISDAVTEFNLKNAVVLEQTLVDGSRLIVIKLTNMCSNLSNLLVIEAP